MTSLHFTKKQRPDPELELLKQELNTAQSHLQQAYHHLDLVVEPELVEACVYEISAIQARCNYLIRTIKAHLGSAACTAEEGVSWV